jgi:NTE family protein
MRVGLVLGGGGVMGGAWLTGALEALARETGWDPASADHVVGTSAGAMMGALCAAGVPPWFMVAHSAGEVFDGLVDAEGRPAADADRAAGAVFRVQREGLRLGPGSVRLGLAALRAPARHTPAAAVTGWLPRGIISTQPLRETIRRVVPAGWAPHPALWIVACDLSTGRRTVFGREGTPQADLADAVAASCAIPGFYCPVRIAGREYVDGGVRSPSNLDVLRGAGLDLAICLNPTSTRDEPPASTPAARVGAIFRRASGRRLGREARLLREAGTEVVLVQPTARDRAVMGPNLMSRRRRHEVIETAIETVGAQLRQDAVRDALRGLPPGEPHKVARPEGSPDGWPELVPGGRRRAASG